MKLSDLQKEFKTYLKSLNASNSASDKKYNVRSKNVSIFSYADELDNFLTDNYKSDIKNAKIKKSDLLKLKFKDGKFVEDEKTNGGKLPLIGIFNDLLKDDKMKCIIDSDGNKKISQEEIKGFIDAIDDLDGEKDDISLKDILTGTKAIQELELDNYMKDIKTSKSKGAKKTRTPRSSRTNNQPSIISRVANALGIGGGNGGWFGSGNNTVQTQPKGPTLEELEQEKSVKETEVKNAQEAYDKVFSGDNEKVKAANEAYNTSKEEYEKLLDEEKNLNDEQKAQLKEADKKVADATKAVDDAQKNLQDAENAVKTQEGVISSGESNLSALKDSLSALNGQSSEDPDKQAEISAKMAELKTKIATSESKLNEDKKKLEELKEKKTEAEKALNDKKTELEQAKEEKTTLEQELIINNENISQELKDSLNKMNEAEKNIQTVKDSEAVAAKSALDTAQKALDEITAKVNEKKAEQTKEENKVSTFDLNFTENLSDTQRASLESFKSNYEQNKDKYKEVEKATGVPAELIAAIHWRESSGDFSTYLHNGERLGQTTTLVPEGIYFGENQWTEAAIDALQRQGTDSINPNDTNSLLDFAERYNGLGYRNKGVASPYVWAGTTNYQGGKYVADGVYDPNHYDQQLGVAVMMKAVS